MNESDLSERNLRTTKRDWRFLAALSIIFAILVVVAAVSFHTDQKTASLQSHSGLVNGKPVADSTASD
ncbi:MAG TPA: hypothetical protein VH206_23680 [Xanthobacteraceae bacterium]|jgi:hypothetical protein|nr:hypothetical protein [Xanthobacteraceae bacterium]